MKAQLCHPTSDWENSWDLPSSRLYLDDVPRSQTPVDPRKPWSFASLVLPSPIINRSASTISSLRGSIPSRCCIVAHHLAVYASPTALPMPPQHSVLGTRYLARVSEVGLYPRLVKPSFARRTMSRTLSEQYYATKS